MECRFDIWESLIVVFERSSELDCLHRVIYPCASTADVVSALATSSGTGQIVAPSLLRTTGSMPTTYRRGSSSFISAHVDKGEDFSAVRCIRYAPFPSYAACAVDETGSSRRTMAWSAWNGKRGAYRIRRSFVHAYPRLRSRTGRGGG